MVKSTMTETRSAVWRSRRNCSSDDGAERTDDGRAFHARAAVTGKARPPGVIHEPDPTRLDPGLRESPRSLSGRVWSGRRLVECSYYTASL